jgi:aminopeptidase N
MRSFHPFGGSAANALLACALPLFAGCGGPITGSDAYDVERYEITGEYDWSLDRLVASTRVTFVVTEPSVSAVELDSRVAQVISVVSDAGDALAFRVDTDAGTLAVDVSSLGANEGSAVSITIEYEAAPGDGLRAVLPRAGDPVAVRTVFTDSEPERARLWMPCHDRPDDRALVSFDMTMAGNERMIANGDVVLDEGEGGSAHRMKYASEVPLPTYLMAFAISDFEVEEAAGGDVPVSVWHRPGVAGDYPGTLAELTRLMDMFQPLLGPYPFARYALVMLPEFSGGMENAGITFQSEVSTAQPALSASLIAHELGHQWFGDAVTVATWDDVWIKEGMAVLLEGEAARPFEDRTATGVLFGERRYVEPGVAARDPSLPPADKYTSGPYDRAAWIYTQIRSVVGEEVFWSTLRGIVKDHLYGTVGTEEVLSAFAPHLGDAAARAAAAVNAKAVPVLEVAPGAAGGARVTVRDPDGILIAPLELEWRREDGTTSREALVPGQAKDVARAAEGDLLVLDPDDVHPDLELWIRDVESSVSYSADLLPLTVPATASALGSFADIAGIHQYSLLAAGLPFSLDPDGLAGFIGSLDADSAQATSLAAACALGAAAEDPVLQQEWKDALTAAATAEPVWRGLPFAQRPGSCGGLLSPLELFAPEWAELSAGLATPAMGVERVFYLTMFDLPFDDSLDVWVPAAKASYSIRIRILAARSVRRALAVAEDGDVPAWRAAVLDVIAQSEASEVLRQIVQVGGWFAEAP